MCPRGHLSISFPHILSVLSTSLPFPSNMSSFASVFTALRNTYPTWGALKTFLTSSEGGNLSVYEIYGTPLAMIRYVKECSNMDLVHVGAFRSVVWNIATNTPISVSAFKSAKGEGLPPFTADITMEEFVDGVMIAQFWDVTTGRWRIHTRSMMDAECHYYSKRSFADLFAEGVAATYGTETPLTDRLEKDVTYTWILQHAENRIVCPVQKPRVVLVAAYRIGTDATLSVAPTPAGVVTPRQYFSKAADATVGRIDMTPVLDVIGMVNRAEHDQESTLHDMAPGYVPVDVPGVVSMIASMRGSVRYQGVVFRSSSDPFGRWKVRSQVYNRVRKMRGNTARRDFLWMDLWSKGALEEYLKFYPEERRPSTDLINRWKAITQTVYKIYVDAFKARTMDRSTIPAKFRPFVYGLHNLYMTSLKPAHKPLDWHATLRWMNERDTAQKIFVLNWDLRQERQMALPLEPQATAAFRAAEAAQEVEEGEVIA